MGDPRGMPRGGRMPGRDPRDPRARGYEEEGEEEQSGLGAGKSMGIIALCFVLGAGLAFGFFKISAPKVSTDPGTPSTTAPAASPTASPAKTTTPHALIIPSSGYAVIQRMPTAL